MTPIIQFQNVNITYEHNVVIKDFSSDIFESEKIVFVGPSGSGKSSLMNALMGFTPINNGTITVMGKTVIPKNIAFIRQNISWLPQQIQFDFTTSKELFEYPYQFLANKNRTPSHKEIDQVLEYLLLPKDILSRRLDEISGGQKQRLSLASILLLKKPILILDEPTSALDDISSKQVLEYLKSQNFTLLSASHDQYWNDSMNRIIPIKN